MFGRLHVQDMPTPRLFAAAVSQLAVEIFGSSTVSMTCSTMEHAWTGLPSTVAAEPPSGSTVTVCPAVRTIVFKYYTMHGVEPNDGEARCMEFQGSKAGRRFADWQPIGVTVTLAIA